jgi:hypothetical protein
MHNSTAMFSQKPYPLAEIEPILSYPQLYSNYLPHHHSTKYVFTGLFAQQHCYFFISNPAFI